MIVRPSRDGGFQAGPWKFKFKMGDHGKPISAEANSDDGILRFIAVEEWSPTPEELKSFAGEWHSEEAGASFTLVVDGGKVFLVQRPTRRLTLTPQYKDHFTVAGSDQVVWFTRGTGGRLTLHVGASRMRDMPFERVGQK
jgi:hypothetical protein